MIVFKGTDYCPKCRMPNLDIRQDIILRFENCLNCGYINSFKLRDRNFRIIKKNFILYLLYILNLWGKNKYMNIGFWVDRQITRIEFYQNRIYAKYFYNIIFMHSPVERWKDNFIHKVCHTLGINWIMRKLYGYC